MTDKELLELAAKAYWSDNDDVNFSFDENEDAIVFYDPVNQDHNGRDVGLVWNPLTDDGDALRLAVKLGLDVWAHGHTTQVGNAKTGHVLMQKHDGDEYAATRRAIVRAAAEIGKEMP